LLFRFQVFNVLQIFFCWLFFFHDNGGKSFIPGKLETSWIDELTDYADTFLEDEQTRQGNILNNKTKEIGQSLMLLIKEGNAEAVPIHTKHIRLE
jgi:hypothetical protein